MSLPLDKEVMDVPVTRYIMKQDEVSDDLTDLRRHKRGRWSSGRSTGRDYQDWIFAREYDHYNKPMESPEDASEGFVPDTTDLSENGYIPKAYKTRFTLDLVNGYASYNNVFGAQGMTMFAFSDILGDHQIYFGTEMVIDLKRSDYFFSYAYLTRPTDYYFSISHIANEYFWVMI